MKFNTLPDCPPPPCFRPQVPNLDCETTADLKDFLHLALTDSDKLGRLLNPDQVAAPQTIAALAAYTLNVMAAREERRAGNIQQAQTYERACDRIYDTLPGWARW